MTLKDIEGFLDAIGINGHSNILSTANSGTTSFWIYVKRI